MFFDDGQDITGIHMDMGNRGLHIWIHGPAVKVRTHYDIAPYMRVLGGPISRGFSREHVEHSRSESHALVNRDPKSVKNCEKHCVIFWIILSNPTKPNLFYLNLT